MLCVVVCRRVSSCVVVCRRVVAGCGLLWVVVGCCGLLWVVVVVVFVVFVVFVVVVVVVSEADSRSRDVYVNKRLRTNWQEPSSNHKCECSRARKLALNSRTTGRARRMAQNASKSPSLLQIVIELCR